MKAVTKLWIGLLALVLLSPLGLILPARFGAGSAWGEWSAEEIGKLVGYQPSGMARLGNVWKAPMPDYAFKGQESAPLHMLSIWYVVSGLLGLVVVAGVALLLGKVLARRERPDAA
jgi:hypothetical protein